MAALSDGPRPAGGSRAGPSGHRCPPGDRVGGRPGAAWGVRAPGGSVLSAARVVRTSPGLRIGFLRCGLLRRRGLRSGRAGRRGGGCGRSGGEGDGDGGAVGRARAAGGAAGCWVLGAGAVRVGGCAAGFGEFCRAGDGADDGRGGVGDRPDDRVDDRASSEADGEPDGADVGVDVGVGVGGTSVWTSARTARASAESSATTWAARRPPCSARTARWRPARPRRWPPQPAGRARRPWRRSAGTPTTGAPSAAAGAAPYSVPALAKAARAAASPAISSARPGAAAAARSQVTGVSGPWPSSSLLGGGPGQPGGSGSAHLASPSATLRPAVTCHVRRASGPGV